MQFRVRVQGVSTGEGPTAFVTAEGPNWFGALVDGLTELDHALDMQDLSFTMLDDGVSAVVCDPRLGQRFEVVAVKERLAPTDPDATQRGATPIPRTVCALPDRSQQQRESGAGTGAGRPAEASADDTDAFSADAVMRLTDLLERFSDSRAEGARQLLRAAMDVPGGTGGGVLLRGRGSAQGKLVFRAAAGRSAERLLGRRVKPGQGPVGVCALLGVSLNIRNLAQEAQLAGGVISEVGLDVGPMLCVPILEQARLQAMVVLYRGRRAPVFEANDLADLEQLAATFAAYLHALGTSRARELRVTSAEGIKNRGRQRASRDR